MIDYAFYLAQTKLLSPLLDAGCGNGQLLSLCREQGISASGIDINPAAVAACRELGHTADQADALGYLSSTRQAYGSIVAAHLV
jgi:2-polyprenyl-3-methyl-5-hydroxy-6-metoxy-1,4-benzoquinol methylase